MGHKQTGAPAGRLDHQEQPRGAQARLIMLIALFIGMAMPFILSTPSHAASPSRWKEAKGNASQSDSLTDRENKVSNLKGGLRYRVLVDDFVDKSNYSYPGFDYGQLLELPSRGSEPGNGITVSNARRGKHNETLNTNRSACHGNPVGMWQ